VTDADDKAPEQLIRQIRESLVKKIGLTPGYLIPVTREAIPKTAIGKIRRRQLQDRFEVGEFDAWKVQSSPTL